MSGWHVTELVDAIHVYPDYESGHVLGLDCWCGPRIEEEDPETGEAHRIPMVSHNDALERVRPEIEEAAAS